MRIIFSTNLLPGSLIIRLFTWSQWSHVDICTYGDCIGAHPWRGVVLQKEEHIMETQPIVGYVDLWVQDPGAAWDFAKAQVGKPYDYGAIGNFSGLGHRWDDPERWMCSELVAAAMRAGDALEVDKDVTRITPRDLAASPPLQWKQLRVL